MRIEIESCPHLKLNITMIIKRQKKFSSAATRATNAYNAAIKGYKLAGIDPETKLPGLETWIKNNKHRIKLREHEQAIMGGRTGNAEVVTNGYAFSQKRGLAENKKALTRFFQKIKVKKPKVKNTKVAVDNAVKWLIKK